MDAVAETWGPLLSGRLLIVASENEARNPRELFSLISRERITRLVTVPSLAWSMVESEGVGEDLKSLAELDAQRGGAAGRIIEATEAKPARLPSDQSVRLL